METYFRDMIRLVRALQLAAGARTMTTPTWVDTMDPEPPRASSWQIAATSPGGWCRTPLSIMSEVLLTYANHVAPALVSPLAEEEEAGIMDPTTGMSRTALARERAWLHRDFAKMPRAQAFLDRWALGQMDGGDTSMSRFLGHMEWHWARHLWAVSQGRRHALFPVPTGMVVEGRGPDTWWHSEHLHILWWTPDVDKEDEDMERRLYARVQDVARHGLLMPRA